MKKSFRFYIALWGAKAGTVLLKLLRRNATFFPGRFALKICPDFMGKSRKHVLKCCTGHKILEMVLTRWLNMPIILVQEMPCAATKIAGSR